MENFIESAEKKLFSELKKSERANLFVENSEKIAKLKAELKVLQDQNTAIEAILLGEIGLKYQPKSAEYILRPKVEKGRKSASYASIVKYAPKICNMTTNQKNKFSDLIVENTKINEDKKTIQIIKNK